MKQTLTQNDMAKRAEMCQWFESKIKQNPDFLQNVWFSGEAHFSPSGPVNSRNSVVWKSQAPDEVLQRPLHFVKCTAWVFISKHGIIGPFWFENDFGEKITVNKERYIVVLKKFWRTLCARRGVYREEQWFQQDSATSHTVNITVEWLHRHFTGQLISRRRIPEWSPHSPDLNPPDFSLWGFLKDHLYQNNPQAIAERKVAIT